MSRASTPDLNDLKELPPSPEILSGRVSEESERHSVDLQLDDAFSSGDDEPEPSFDFASAVISDRSRDVPDDEDAAGQAFSTSEISNHSGVPNGSATGLTPIRRVPPPLTLITEPSPTLPVPYQRGQFQDIDLSPPPSPAFTTSLSPYSVPIPVSPSPMRVNSPALPQNGPPLPLLRTVSPKPQYLSPSSTIPLPPPSPGEMPRTHLAPTSPNHRPTRSIGPSTFEKVVSKTRPSYLPPKTREEDKKHMKDWEEMMKQSRVAEEKRAQDLKARRASRELAVEDSIHIWEREIVPDWRSAVRKSHLRQLWWKGIPTKLRGKMWAAAVGNGLALSKDNFKTCLSRAHRALRSRSFPADSLQLIEDDILHTLPNLNIFHPEHGPMYQDLKDILCAWVVARSDEGLGYVRGASTVAGMLVINMPLDQAFVAMRNLLERHCMRSFYGGDGSEDDIEAYYRIFDTLLADGMPKVYFNFKQHQISPSLYLPDWLGPLFLNHLPFEVCARIWDVIILEGDSFMFRSAIAVLGVIEARLFFPDRKELLEVLRGENKAALEIAKRTGVQVNLSARYEQYGLTEEALWDRIHGMEEWWRESTWSRLIQRELPDL